VVDNFNCNCYLLFHFNFKHRNCSAGIGFASVYVLLYLYIKSFFSVSVCTLWLHTKLQKLLYPTLDSLGISSGIHRLKYKWESCGAHSYTVGLVLHQVVRAITSSLSKLN
jgi:hypothetical protein